jgi:hypothetical protein
VIELTEVRDWDDAYNGHASFYNLDILDIELYYNTPAHYRASVLNQLKRSGRAVVALGKRADGGIDYDVYEIVG